MPARGAVPRSRLITWAAGRLLGKEPAAFGDSMAGMEWALFCAVQLYCLPTVGPQKDTSDASE